VQKIKDCLFADDVLYDTERNAWVRMEGDLAFVGIDTALAWLSGPFSWVSFKPLGTVVERGKSLGGVEGPRHFDTVKSPLTGRIVLVNSALIGNPKLLNNDPYGSGWFAKIEPLKLDQEKAALLGIAAARPFLEKKITDMNIRCFAEFPDYEMYEIGSECAGILVKLDDLIARSPMGTVVHLVSDEPTSEIEMIGWSERAHEELLEVRKEGKLFHFIVKKTS